MTLNILFAASAQNWKDYQIPLTRALKDAGVLAHLSPDLPADLVDYIIYAPSGGLTDFTPFRRAKAVLSLWAGVERIVGNSSLKLPVARMVDPSLSQGMIEWVCGHVLRHHLGMDQHIHNPQQHWNPAAPPLAWARKLGVLGLGALGMACAQSLKQLGFQVSGWSRRPKSIEGIAKLFAPFHPSITTA